MDIELHAQNKVNHYTVLRDIANLLFQSIQDMLRYVWPVPTKIAKISLRFFIA